jgi:acyl dehydratase
MNQVERRELVAHLAALPMFPGDDLLPEELGGHVMGATVHAWLGAEPLQRWGSAWLEGGWMALRFRRPLHVGDPLTLEIEHDATSTTFELYTPTAVVVAEAQASMAGPVLPDPQSFVDGPLPDPPVAPLPDALAGRNLGIELDFEAARDLVLFARLDPDDPAGEVPVAHPAWVSSGVNALIARSVAMTHGRWKHAGTAVRSLRPIRSGARVRLLGRVERLFEAGQHRFADVATLTVADGEPSMVVVHTIVYG